MNLILFAQTTQAPAGPNLSFLLLLLAMFGVFYFVLIRPQRKKQAELKKMVEALRKGDRVMTNGGIFGTVSGMKDNIVILKIAENTKIEVLKSAIGSIVEKSKSE